MASLICGAGRNDNGWRGCSGGRRKAQSGSFYLSDFLLSDFSARTGTCIA
jgi:hypothetical protein